VTDPKGVVTTLTYDLRQRVKSRQVGTGRRLQLLSNRVTGNDHAAGIPAPFNTGYDAAHRLTDVTDSMGNHIHYTLDGMGNRTAENAYDPSNVLHRTHSEVYNSLNELYQDVNAAGTPAVTTTFGYDNNGKSDECRRTHVAQYE